ncbi:MAG: tetratricopeptide repeat protein [Desulfoarculaceae bacterium]|nr:tetratricopeptide repeat protein [Desulfoarculaceae bacterium]
MVNGAGEGFDGFINLDGEKVHVSDADRVSKDILKRLPQGSDQWNLLRQLAMYCWEEGHFDASCVYLRQILALADDPPAKADCYLKLGQVQEAADDYLGALRSYEEAFTLDSGRNDTSYFLHNNRGFCLNQLGRYDEAETYCRKAIEINGDRYNAYKNLGVALQGQGRYAEAAECFLRAAFIFPPDYRSIEHLEELFANHREEVEREIPDIVEHLEAVIEAHHKLIQ